jgi:hypothetical protein
MTNYIDSDHVHDLVTRRYITGILVVLNNIPIRWISMQQKTVDTSTNGSELVASRIYTELILEIWSLGVALDGAALTIRENMSMVLNNTVTSSVLKKKHNAIAYHQIREAIVARIMRFP